jgi:DNA polymerase III alpha subunit
VVISDSPLVGLVPLKQEKNYLLALFEEDKLALLGLKKYDFLSLKETFAFINFNFVQESREFFQLLKLDFPSYQSVDLQDEKT